MISRHHGQRGAVVEGHHTGILLTQPLSGVTDHGLVSLMLLEGIRFHEMPVFTVVIEVLHVLIDHVGPLEGISGFKSPLPDPSGFEVAQAHAIKRLSLAGFHEFILHNRTGITV